MIARFTSPKGTQQVAGSGALITGSPQAGEWSVPLEFPQFSEQGGWHLTLELWDTFGNHRTYTSSQLEGAGLCARINLGVPVIEAIRPRYGKLEGGDHVTISGVNLGQATSVHFGTTPASFEIVSPTTILATAPKGSPAGTVDVTVTTPSGSTETSAADRFTYVKHEEPPTVKKLTPKKGPAAGGTTVTITGTELEGVTSITFGGQQATSIENTSSKTVTVVVPEGTTGTVQVIVATPYGASNGKASFKYERPVIQAVSPNTGPLTGGNTITITGHGFAPGTNTTSFSFGKAAASEAQCSSTTSCTVTVPKAKKPGTIDILAAVGKTKSKKNPPTTQYTYK